MLHISSITSGLHLFMSTLSRYCSTASSSCFSCFLSIDKIELVKDILINYVAKEAPNVYILLAVISYEFAKDTRCVDCYNGKEVKFRLGYDSYAKFIKQTAKIRDQRCSD